ncbi:glutamate-1-semialdehyde 2,1-aminomutase [Myxococcota bacterium]|nr:glutamate-1-semialdehyde 2,1-aminomutase [Myxococcota bacterium]MBU1431931.1 glutamate-1-semialdehyde 2,1-aminomutase [Myxococcota bacterium]MBU1896359.1 glutamate-1-semialdehyde 2,1-aminomutase [Myxococcota bacterium]
MSTKRSEALFAEARQLMPGGVNSPVRAFRSVGGTPRVLVEGKGAYVTDADDNRYIDLVGSWGPLIAGHAHPKVVSAITAAAQRGTTFGAPCPDEIELARRVIQAVPIAEKARFVSSGTEAVMTAVRLARGFTKRDRVVVFQGCYHGHSDALLVSGGSGIATLGLASTAGVTAGAVADTFILPLDDEEAVNRLFDEHGATLAAVLIEPIPANSGLLLQRQPFLELLRRRCTQHGALLIFDEVISGFRASRGGAGPRLGITPDIVTLGKIVGGGLPVGAVVASAKIMNTLAPDGPVYQAGTLSGNPLAMAAGVATLDLLDEAAYTRLEVMGARLQAGLEAQLAAKGVAGHVVRVGSILWLTFSAEAPRAAWSDAEAVARYAAFHAAMLAEGVYMAPSAYEVAFLSLSHGKAEVDAIIAAAGRALEAL